MKFFRRYIFPALFGLLVYFTVRLLHDVEGHTPFWRRNWGLNLIEMSCSVAAGYLGIYLFESLFRFFDRRWPLQFNYKSIARELAIFVSSNLLLMNLTLVPMAALTDDGLSWADFADLTTIPTLYAIIYYGISRTSTWLKAYVNNKTQLDQIVNDHLQTELKFLKAQYHPHFLFNALNTIYFQMDEDVAGAKRSIEKFSELLRYQLYDQQTQVPITQEIEYLKNFIELQKIRSSHSLKLETNFGGHLNGQMVYPLLFLPLVENAFKFVGGDYEMRISADAKDGVINFSVENSVPDFKPGEGKPGGIGLENLRRRLDLLYPGKHKLNTQNGGRQFMAQLSIAYE
jgi:sensor histidine kinase YesM